MLIIKTIVSHSWENTVKTYALAQKESLKIVNLAQLS